MTSLRGLHLIVVALIAALTATLPVTSVAAPTAPVMTAASIDAGLTTLTVKGTGFGTSGATLTLDGLGNLAITSQTNTAIVATLPSNPPVAPGSYLLSLTVGGKSDEFWLTIGTQGPAGPTGPTGLTGPPGPGLATGTITGSVTGCGSTPVAHALVYIPGRSFLSYTGASGSYQLDYVSGGSYSVVIEVPNVTPVTLAVAVMNGVITSTGATQAVNTSSDPNNCGSCGNVCSTTNGASACVSGTCQLKCNPGFADCDQNAADGCETNIGADINNCGACGNVCSATNGTAACTAGVCQVASCTTGFANCDGKASNGCEANLNTSINNCGACGNTCSQSNAVSACSNGACQITSCSPGFGDCNGIASDGCETNLQTSLNNCGACGNTCSAINGTPACSAGACSIAACNAGFANCDGNPANGCEINIAVDVNNCGACGHACLAGQACSNGSCI